MSDRDPSKRRRAQRPRTPAKRELTLRLTGDRRTAELVQLEIRRLARRLGLPAATVRIRRLGDLAR